MKCFARIDTMVGALVVIRVPIGVAELVDDLVNELLRQRSVWEHRM